MRQTPQSVRNWRPGTVKYLFDPVALIMQAWNPKLTAAAVVERQGRFLIVREHTAQGIRLNQPAGHLDPGESLAQAAARETFEETGWQVRPVALIGMYLSRYQSAATATDVTYLRFTFLCEALEHDTARVLDDGIIEALWLTADEIRTRAAEHRSPQVLQSLDDHLSGCRYPLEMLITDPRCLYKNLTSHTSSH